MNALFVAWRSGDPDQGSWGPVGRLEHGPGGYRFVYTRGAILMKGFHAFAGMQDLDAVYESEELFPLFANRLLAKSRPEYEAYLTWGGFDPNNPPDPIAVLGVTEGLRATDSLELFPCPSPDEDGCYISKFFVHGVRWIPEDALQRVNMLRLGDKLNPRPEDQNVHDAKAVALWTDDGAKSVKVGYVPRYLAREVREVLARCSPDRIVLSVERVNESAPLQQRILCRMTSCWPDGFRPCSDEFFEPIANAAPFISVH